jgi:hypothetical protein
MLTNVFNVRTGKLQSTFVGIAPRSATIAAYAQSLGDWNTSDYEQKYGAMVDEGQWGFLCGTMWAAKGRI